MVESRLVIRLGEVEFLYDLNGVAMVILHHLMLLHVFSVVLQRE